MEIQMLEKLCRSNGVSGNEGQVRTLINNSITNRKTHTDVMGNLLVEGDSRVMLAAHMDEVGLIISRIEDNGFLRFKAVGGIDTGVLIGKKVFIGENKIAGIIGIKAIHLQKKDEAAPEEKELYIDIGADSGEEAKALAALGDYASFEPIFEDLGDGLILSKALDDRAGCAITLSLIKKHNVCCAFTAQEEVGCRGARAAAEFFRPKAAIVVEATICRDVYPAQPKDSPTRLGAGPVITFMDGTSIPNRKLRASLEDAADKHGIAWQYKKTNMGGTDAGAISAAGIPVAIVALPCRFLHSPSTVISMKDYENTLKLLDIWLSEVI